MTTSDGIAFVIIGYLIPQLLYVCYMVGMSKGYDIAVEDYKRINRCP